MTVTPLGQYPVYTAGQTLTAADLNDERDHLVGRDRLLGRTVGFGVAAGLEGTVNGAGGSKSVPAGWMLTTRRGCCPKFGTIGTLSGWTGDTVTTPLCDPSGNVAVPGAIVAHFHPSLPARIRDTSMICPV